MRPIKNKMNIHSISRLLLYFVLVAVLYFFILSYWSTAEALYFSLHFSFFQVLLVHLTTSFLQQRFYTEISKFIIYSLLFLLVFSLISVGGIKFAAVHILPPRTTSGDSPEISFIWLFITHLAILGVPQFFSTFLYMLSKEKEHRFKIESLENLQLAAELKFLKSQINPHFLFNALNSIYVISYLGDKSTPSKILMLSDMLRYVLYDCVSESVPIHKELSYIESFISFQRLRSDESKNIKLDTTCLNQELNIAPMIIMPFVENCFKYSGIDNDKSAWIDFEFTSIGSTLTVIIKNSLQKQNPNKPVVSIGGIGLKNVKKRLNILYPNKHSLVIEKSQREFSIQLIIDVA